MLHTKCAGEVNKPLELNAIRCLYEFSAELGKPNGNGETCFHVAARNGHTEVLKLLFDLDENAIRTAVQEIEEKNSATTSSLVASAVRSDHLETATWFDSSTSFFFCLKKNIFFQG